MTIILGLSTKDYIWLRWFQFMYTASGLLLQHLLCTFRLDPPWLNRSLVMQAPDHAFGLAKQFADHGGSLGSTAVIWPAVNVGTTCNCLNQYV